jgi:hypothetical protein
MLGGRLFSFFLLHVPLSRLAPVAKCGEAVHTRGQMQGRRPWQMLEVADLQH